MRIRTFLALILTIVLLFPFAPHRAYTGWGQVGADVAVAQTANDNLNFIFAPDTPKSYVAKVYSRMSKSLLAGYNLNNHWNPSSTASPDDGASSAQGESVILTWSIIPDGTTMPSQFSGDATCNSSLIADMNARYGVGNWQAEMTKIFADWGDKTGNQYHFEPHDDGAAWPNTRGELGVRGDLRIGGCTIDGNSNTLAYNFFPSNGDMKIDSTDSWYDSAALATGFHNVISHEHGHGAGISHVCPVNQTKLMEPFVTTAFVGLQHDDLRAAQRYYGDRFETVAGQGNDVAARAAALDAVPDGTQISLTDLSIDDDSDVDWYQFTAANDSKQLDVRLTPVGLSYLSGPQNSNGTCSAGTLLDSATIHDLRIDLFDADGTTLLAGINANGAGGVETLANVPLGAAGTKYLRISGSAANDIQLYNLDLRVEPGAQFTLGVTPTEQAICAPGDTQFTVEIGQIAGVTAPVTLSTNGLPAGATATFSTNPVTPSAASALTIDANGSAPPGSYAMTVLGNALSGERQVPLQLEIYTAPPGTATLQRPAHNAIDVPIEPELSWGAVPQATTYLVEVATDAEFTTIIDAAVVETTRYTPTLQLDYGTNYYWRVSTQSNACGSGSRSAPFHFRTNEAPTTVCSTPNLAIPDNDATGVSDELLIGNMGTILDVNVILSVTHTYVGDLTLILEQVTTGKRVILLDTPLCSQNNIYVTADDEADLSLQTNCGETGTNEAYTVGGSYQPLQPLSSFDGEGMGGPWRLHVTDDANLDTGYLEGWCLTTEAATTTPVAPELTIATDGTDVMLQWSTNVGDEQYAIHRSTIPFFQPGAATLQTIENAGVNTYTDVGAAGNVAAGTFYRVRAITASQPRDSNEVGAISYAINNSGNGYSLVAVPFANPTLATAADLATEIGHVTALLQWNPVTQSFRFFTPPNTGDNFAVTQGDTIFVGVDSGGPSSITFVGDVAAIQHTLLPGRYNFLSLPLQMAALSDAASVAAEMGEIEAMLAWNEAGQSFRFFSPPAIGDNFAIAPGAPFIIFSTTSGATSWPTTN